MALLNPTTFFLTRLTDAFSSTTDMDTLKTLDVAMNERYNTDAQMVRRYSNDDQTVVLTFDTIGCTYRDDDVLFVDGFTKLEKIVIGREVHSVHITNCNALTTVEGNCPLYHIDTVRIENTAVETIAIEQTIGDMTIIDCPNIVTYTIESDMDTLFVKDCPTLATISQTASSMDTVVVRDCKALDNISFDHYLDKLCVYNCHGRVVSNLTGTFAVHTVVDNCVEH